MTLDTGNISIPRSGNLVPLGTIALLNPNFAASFNRSSIWETVRTCPPNPTSPIKTVLGSTILSRKLATIATAIPKSTAGSSTFNPPRRSNVGI